jgi:hypothetical protein
MSHNTEMEGGRGSSGICGEFLAGGVAGCAELLQNFWEKGLYLWITLAM